jgi:hypothetical protein
MHTLWMLMKPAPRWSWIALVILALGAACSGAGTGGVPSTLAPLQDATVAPGGVDSTLVSTLPVISIEPVPLAGLVLGAAGLGEAVLGEDTETTVRYVSSLLGSPTADTGWLETEEAMILCDRKMFRQVEWGVLRLEFGDTSPYRSDAEHFVGWDYGLDGRLGEEPQGLITERGVGLGSRVDELLAAYPAAQLFDGEEGTFPPTFTEADGLSGYTTGTADSDVITVIEGGLRCG